MVFIKNQTITFFTLKMKTFAMVYIESKCFSRSKATLETLFARSSYAKSRHFDQKPLFTFSEIAQ